jgi:flagellar motor switch protein FliN
MADPSQPSVEGQPNADDTSWEDAFREITAGQNVRMSSSAEEQEPAPSAVSAMPKPAAAAAGAVGAREGVDMDFLLDIPLEVTVEVGRTKMIVNDLLQLQQGSVIDLEKMVGEPFEVYVNRKIMAYGEVVVVNEKFGIRLTDIIEPKERIQQLG